MSRALLWFEITNAVIAVILISVDQYPQACTNMLAAIYARSVRKDVT